MTDAPEKRKPGRPRGARPERLASGKQGARLTLTIDGESVRRRVQLETADPAVAQKKAERLQSAEHASPPAPCRDTFREVAAVVFAAREKRGVARVDIELGRVAGHVYPFVGALSAVPFGDRILSAITADEVTELLSAKRDAGYSFDHVKKMRTGMKYVFEHGKLPTVDQAPMPPFQAALKKHRAVASDEVLLAYLAWEHPVERFRAGVRMRQAMSAVSRCIGGQRTNDLHVATWEDNLQVPERGEPDFLEVWVPRTKGQAPQLLETPEGVRPMLRLWWEQSGKPRRGPVFPLLRGKRAGEARDEVQDSHAHALRQDLQRALGIEAWDPTAGTGQKGPVGRWVPGRAPTPKEKPLFEEGRYTLPLDFHSWRRAWSQALKKVGANVQTSAALTGHAADLRAHGRYLSNPTEAQQVPAGVVPNLSKEKGFGREPAKTQIRPEVMSNDSGRARRDSNAGPLASEGNAQMRKQPKTAALVTSGQPQSDAERPSETARGQNARTEISAPLTLTEATLWELLALASKGKRTDLARAVTEQLDALARALPPNVTRLDSRRRQ